MKRKVGWVMLLTALGVAGGQTAFAGKFMSSAFRAQPEGARTGGYLAQEAPGMVGPYGKPIMVTSPGGSGAGGEMSGADYARAMLSQQFPPAILQQVAHHGGGMPGGPGMGGGYPVMMPGGPVHHGPPGAVAAVGALGSGGPGMGGPGGPGGGPPGGVMRTEVRFVGPGDMKISWYAPTPDGRAGFAPQHLVAPARYNFLQASIYRLKLSDIPGRPGVNLYPTLEVVPSTMKTATFLAHSAVPVSFTEEDFEQVAAGNFVVKVIYLPDPQFQDLAAGGPDEVVSSRLEPGVDPIVEAKRRGSIMAIIRLGNIDLEAPNTPAMDAPPPGMGPGMPAGMMPNGMMLPPGMKPPAGGPVSAPKPGATPLGAVKAPGTGVQQVAFPPRKSR